MHGKIKQLFMISCAFVPLFFNANAFCFLSRCQTHAHGLHRSFVDKNSRNSPGISHVFITNKRLSSPRTGNLRPVGVRIKFGTTQNGFKQNFINKELCNFSHFQVNVKSYDNFSLFVR